MSADDLERFEADMEMALYREYRDVAPMFTYVVETDKRFYLANTVEVTEHVEGNDTYFEVLLSDAWVWDMYRAGRLVSKVRILTFGDLNIEELKRAPAIPDSPAGMD